MNPRPEVNKWLVTVSVMLPTLIEILDTSVANVSLKHIQGSMSAGQEEVTWVLTSYLVANAIVIPMSGWLARFMGRKRYLLISLGVFTVSSLLCGTATSLAELIMFRIVQGMGGGGLQPMSQAILMETFPARQRGLAMAIFGIGVVLGPILGPMIGGYLTDHFSWRWIFYINLPVGILGAYMIGAYIHDPDYMERRTKGEGIDYMGLVLLTIGIGCLQIVLDKGQTDDWFNSNFITTLAVISAISLISLAFWEIHRRQPIIDLRILARNKSFAVGTAVMFLGFFAIFGCIVLLPLYLQTLMGYNAFLAGLVLGPGGALALLVMPIAGKLTERIDARYILTAGMIINAYALIYMGGFNLNISFGMAVTGRAIQGVAIPLFFVSLSYLTFAYVSRRDMNNASALFNLLRNLGGSFGTAFVTTLLARRGQFHHARLAEHMNPLNPVYAERLADATRMLDAKLGGLVDHTQAARTLMYAQMNKQATCMAFIDTFHAQALIFIFLVGAVWIMRKPPIGKAGPGPAAH